MIATRLESLDACDEAIVWAGRRSSPERAWRACERGDWLLWLAARVGVDRRLIVLAACDCAEPALVYVPAGEDRPRIAIETARAWTRGEATREEVRITASAADDAASAAYAADAGANATNAYAAYAFAAVDAAFAVDSAAAAANAAAYAAHAAYAAAYAAFAATAAFAVDSAAAASARRDALKRCAKLVRAQIPWTAIETRLAAREVTL